MIKRYVQTRNRDHELVLTEDKGQNFLEWPRYVLASDYDALAAERDAARAVLADYQKANLNAATCECTTCGATVIRVPGKFDAAIDAARGAT